MAKEKLNTDDLEVKKLLSFIRGSKTRLKATCIAKGRTTTTFYLIQAAYDTSLPDTEAQDAVRQIARETFLSKQDC